MGTRANKQTSAQSERELANKANELPEQIILPNGETLQSVSDRMKQGKADEQGKKLDGATSADKAIIKLQAEQAQKSVAMQLAKDLNIEQIFKTELAELLAKHKAVICLEKSGAHYAYKGSDLNFFVKHKNNVMAYFKGATAENFLALKQIAKEVKGAPKFLRLINVNGKSVNLGSIAKLQSLSDMFEYLKTIQPYIQGSQIITIPAETRVSFVLDAFMVSRANGLKALESELKSKAVE